MIDNRSGKKTCKNKQPCHPMWSGVVWKHPMESTEQHDADQSVRPGGGIYTLSTLTERTSRSDWLIQPTSQPMTTGDGVCFLELRWDSKSFCGGIQKNANKPGNK